MTKGQSLDPSFDAEQPERLSALLIELDDALRNSLHKLFSKRV